MVVRYMPNFGHGGPNGIRVMTIFVFYVSAQIPNIEYLFKVYGGLQALGGISCFFSLNFLSNAVRIMSGDLFWVAFLFSFVFLLFLFLGIRPREVAHFLSSEISRRIPSESCLGTPWGLSYEHICENMYFCQGRCG